MSATEPPTGRDMDLFVAEARSGALARIRPARKRLGRTVQVLGAAAFMVVGATAGAAAASSFLGTEVGTGPTTFTIPAPERAASSLRVTITCRGESGYTVTVPSDPEQWIGLQCDASSATGSSVSGEFSLGSSTGPQSVVVSTDHQGATFSLEHEYIYLDADGSEYPRNSAGQTYGKLRSNSATVPDLVFVGGDGLDGDRAQGYVLWLDVAVPVEQFPESDPSAYRDWIEQFNSTYPAGKPVPMYAVDGHTVVGTYLLFH
jgi:hypothetical protein